MRPYSDSRVECTRPHVPGENLHVIIQAHARHHRILTGNAPFSRAIDAAYQMHIHHTQRLADTHMFSFPLEQQQTDNLPFQTYRRNDGSHTHTLRISRSALAFSRLALAAAAKGVSACGSILNADTHESPQVQELTPQAPCSLTGL
jgi:hypothetical protein